MSSINLEEISDNLDKMVLKFQELVAQNNESISKHMYFKDKKEDAKKKTDELHAKLLERGIDPSKDGAEVLEKRYKDIGKSYMESVEVIKHNQNIISELNAIVSNWKS